MLVYIYIFYISSVSYFNTEFISGGHTVYYLAISAFIADITTPENRALRYAIVYFAGTLAGPLGPIIGTDYLYPAGKGDISGF